FDKIILVRPDYFSHKSIGKLAKISTEMVGYFWDSIGWQDAQYVKQTAHLYKNLFTYDKKNQQYLNFLNLKFISNFYYPLEQM
ncbi:hypothetical protein U2053_14675, partial [Listeria monocytogenes]|uniref:hypothetical protein n=1 Tax=Listeria monocytogenes TaxID=1639 RepID=UPI002FDB9A17